jgi:excisionase family DNA binding protein
MTTTRGTTTNDGVTSSSPTLTPMLLTPEQAAHVLGIGRTSVYELLRKGELVSVKLGRSRRIPYRFLVDFVDHVVAPDSSGQ